MVYDENARRSCEGRTARVGVYNGALAGKTGTTSLPNDDKEQEICGSSAIHLT